MKKFIVLVGLLLIAISIYALDLRTISVPNTGGTFTGDISAPNINGTTSMTTPSLIVTGTGTFKGLVSNGAVEVNNILNVNGKSNHTQSLTVQNSSISINSSGSLSTIRMENFYNDDNSNSMLIRGSRGTVTSTSALQNLDSVFDILAQGHDGNVWRNLTLIRSYVDGAPSYGSISGGLSFRTTSNSGSISEKVTISNKGDFTVTKGSTTVNRLTVNGNIGIGNSNPLYSIHLSSGTLYIDGAITTNPTSIYSKGKIAMGAFSNATIIASTPVYVGEILYNTGTNTLNVSTGTTQGSYTSYFDVGGSTAVLKPQLRFMNDQSTGGGTALLGANSPATTLSAPYTWIAIMLSDGDIGYFPVWK